MFAGLFARVHGGICALEQGAGIVRIQRRDGVAHGQPHLAVVRTDHKGLANRLDELFTQLLRLPRVFDGN